MAFSSKLEKSGQLGPGGPAFELYKCFFNAVQTGTVTLKPSTRDLRNAIVRVKDQSTANTGITAALNIETGVVSLAAAVADNVLTGESGGSAGASTFTATGAVVGQTVAGTGIPAQAVVTSVSGTTVKIDKNLTAAVGADIVGNSYALLEVLYY